MEFPYLWSYLYTILTLTLDSIPCKLVSLDCSSTQDDFLYGKRAESGASLPLCFGCWVPTILASWSSQAGTQLVNVGLIFMHIV